jgi:type VII secretion protein EccB
MTKPPVTRMQLDAYRFGQRRLESALALRDPVPLHEQLRTQRRVVALGLVAAVLLTCGLLAYVHLTGGDGWTGRQLVADERSGQLYVVLHRPDRLVPVDNLAAARLVLAATAPAGGPAGLLDGSPGDALPTLIRPERLAGARFTARAALPGAPDTTLPGDDTPLAPAAPWALCADAGGRTAVVDGATGTRPLAPGTGLVVAHRGADYLLTGGRRYRIGPGGAAAYDLTDAMVGAPELADAVFALIPAGPDLAGVRLAGDDPSSGGVVAVDRPGQPRRFYVLVPGGAAEVPGPMAALLRAGRGEDLSRPPRVLDVGQIDGYPRQRLTGIDQYPPAVTASRDAPVVCRQWDDTGGNPVLSTAERFPAPDGQPMTTLAQADGAGPALDEVSVPAGSALAVSAVTGSNPGGPRGYWLVSATGVGYPVADADTARALGIGTAVPVPVEVLTALVQGHPLDLAEAGRTADVPAAH